MVWFVVEDIVVRWYNYNYIKAIKKPLLAKWFRSTSINGSDVKCGKYLVDTYPLFN